MGECVLLAPTYAVVMGFVVIIALIGISIVANTFGISIDPMGIGNSIEVVP